MAGLGQEMIQEVLHPTRIACEEEGLTLRELIKTLKKELKANETKFFSDKGKVVEIHDVVDWGTRQRARQDAHKLRGDYPAERHQVDANVTVNVISYADVDGE